MSLPLSRLTTTLALALGIAGHLNAQVPGGANRQFMLINATRASAIQKELDVAGSEGMAVVASREFSVALKKDSKGPRRYQLVAPDDPKLLSQALSEGAAEGFRIVRTGVWKFGGRYAVILESQADGDRFAYDVVDAEDAQTLRTKQLSGASRVAVLDQLVILERREGSQNATAAVLEYRIVSASRPATLEKEVKEAAAAGYRAIGAAKMSVVMERDPATPAALEYRVVAVARLPTLRRELQTAGAEGFEIAVIPTRDNEFVAVLERPLAGARKLDYAVEELTEKNIEEKLQSLDAEGYALEHVSGIRVLGFARRTAR